MPTAILAGVMWLGASYAVFAAEIQIGAPDFQPSSEHPVGFRGDGTGRYPGATRPTTAWMSNGDVTEGKYQNKNILWKTELKGFTESTPIVVGDRVITLEEPDYVVCLDANTGKLLWRVECDHLKLFPADKEARGRALMREVNDNYYSFDSLIWEYDWIKGSWPPFGPDKKAAPKDAARILEIEKIWKERAYGGTPSAPLSAGHGCYPFAVGTPEYGKLADALTELQVDFGIAPMLHISNTQMAQHGMTQGTPTSDGKSIFATFASGQTVCLNLDGKVKWMKWYPHDIRRDAVRAAFNASPWLAFIRKGFTGMSPLLVDDKLIVTQGYVIRGLQKDSGTLAWEVKYGDGIEASAERRAFKGPSLLTLADGDKALIFPQGYVIRPSDGAVLSSLSPWEMFDVPWGNAHCAVMGLTTDGDTCYFSWGAGCGAVRVVKKGKDEVVFSHLWRNTIAESVPSGNIDSQPPHGLSAETLIETAALLDPVRKRLYISLHEKGLWAMDATNGKVLAHMDAPHQWNGGPPFGTPSNELVNPILVGGKYVFSCRESGGTSVYDADDITHVISENQVYPDITRDMKLWQKPWNELKSRTIDRYFYTGTEWIGGNDDHRTPSDVFIQGDKVFVRSIEGIVCAQARGADQPK